MPSGGLDGSFEEQYTHPLAVLQVPKRRRVGAKRRAAGDPSALLAALSRAPAVPSMQAAATAAAPSSASDASAALSAVPARPMVLYGQDK
ncbi:hypothetical protein MNEG_9807, partial [Monoraphidium neglectum]